MAFQPRNLAVLAYANSFTLWTYQAGGDAVLNDNYFNGAGALLREGDVVYCVQAMMEMYDPALDMHFKTSPRTIQVVVLSDGRNGGKNDGIVKVEKL